MLHKELNEKHLSKLTLIGAYLKEIRFGEGMTRAEVCNETNMHLHTLMRIETKKTGYNIIHIFELADFYGVSASEIFSIVD